MKSQITFPSQSAESLVALQAAHDIRSPLTLLNMIAASLPEGSEEQKRLLKLATQRISDIADDLVKKSHEASESSRDTTNIHAVLQDLVDEKRAEHGQKTEIQFILETKSASDISVMLPRVELTRAISNLINNSVEALVDGGQIKITAEMKDNNLLISIEDNGCGIPAKVLQSLGSERVSYGKGKKGFGLGLYHAKKTVRQAFGKLNIHSSEGVGTKISVILPCA